MSKRTESESMFEEFCNSHELPFERIQEGKERVPDYRLMLDGVDVFVEVKQIDEDVAFTSTSGSRTPGSHIRAKINQSRGQVRSAASKGSPTILLVYNNLDPYQMFGTEPHDFMVAMYGDLTVSLYRMTGKISNSFHGRNKAFRKGKNDSFSAVGWLHSSKKGISIHLYENMHAKVQLNYEFLPTCLTYYRVEFVADGNELIYGL